MLDQVKLNNIKCLLYVYLHFFSLAMVGTGDGSRSSNPQSSQRVSGWRTGTVLSMGSC